MSSEYSERVDLFLFQIRSLGVLYSLTMRIVASSLKEGEFRIKDIGESVPKRIFLSLFFQNLIFTKRLILLYSLPEHRKKLIFIVFRFNVFGSFLMPVKIPQNSDSVLQLIQSISRHGHLHLSCMCVLSHSVMSDSSRLHELWQHMGSSARGIFQVCIQKQAAVSYVRKSSPPRDQTQIS